MGLPWRSITLSSAVAAYLFSIRKADWTGQVLLVNFVGAWAAQWSCWAVWSILLWPRFFSPLRDLPQPSGASLFNGHFSKILAEPSGIPHREWYAAPPPSHPESASPLFPALTPAPQGVYRPE
jgi:hypothetical protein